MAASHNRTTARTTEEVVGQWRAAYDRRDVESALELVASDLIWTLAPGAFTGREGARQVLEWDVRLSPAIQGRLSGIGTLVKDNVAVMERVVEASAEGVAYEYPIVTIFELDDEHRIRRLRSYYDKLAILRQVANGYPGIKGWVLSRLVNFVAAQAETGLERSGAMRTAATTQRAQPPVTST